MLSIATVLEVTGTTRMNLSAGFTKPGYAAGTAPCYAACFARLTQVLKPLKGCQTYAIRAGAGTTPIAVVGAVFIGEALSFGKAVSLLLIVAGVAGVRLLESAL